MSDMCAANDRGIEAAAALEAHTISRQMRGGQMWMAGVALAMVGCASTSSSVRQCSQLSGLYEPSSCTQEEPKPLTDLQLPDGTPLAGVKLLTVEQTSCNEVRIVS